MSETTDTELYIYALSPREHPIERWGDTRC